ncbi:hypothetical protein JYU34_013656 [Plutella xylostella]|uniref:Cilia- and flagella-associated protein 61 N-terminal domain-containing protein n=1 Tax=Plutella xylostella TaxID=51655 RepID=A0ABQ7QAM0_PLUXY|nr:hypothetical protein JYU34_013656 [Plutella xylostella]
MSIFFDYEVGANGRRFRRAVDADKADIEKIWNREHTEALFGDVDIGSLMRFFLARNTLFIHFVCSTEAVADFFLEEALSTVFMNDGYLRQVVLVVPPLCPPEKNIESPSMQNLLQSEYSGKNNSFCIELFGLRDDIDQRKLRVRPAEFADIPQIAHLLSHVDGKETIYTIEHSIMGNRRHQAYVMQSGLFIVGVGILEPAEQIDFLLYKFNLGSFHNHKYHYRGRDQTAGFAALKSALIYPCFEPHFRFFARELLRYSGCSTLLWLTAYRNKWVAHKANCLVSSMVPIMPLKSNFDHVQLPALRRFSKMDKNRKNKCIKLTNGSQCDYDMLFLFIGKQFQHPDYLESIFERERDIRLGNLPEYPGRMDVTKHSVEQDLLKLQCPGNVFIVNEVHTANAALNYVKSSKDLNSQIIVYGAVIEAYCCITALLHINIPPSNIIFVEPFPPENPHRARVSAFCNVYVDQTVREVLANLQITVYSAHYFESWTLDESSHLVTHVDFLSTFRLVRLPCTAFFYYGKRGIDPHALVGKIYKNYYFQADCSA